MTLVERATTDFFDKYFKNNNNTKPNLTRIFKKVDKHLHTDFPLLPYGVKEYFQLEIINDPFGDVKISAKCTAIFAHHMMKFYKDYLDHIELMYAPKLDTINN